jgi:hypothetical protein
LGHQRAQQIGRQKEHPKTRSKNSGYFKNNQLAYDYKTLFLWDFVENGRERTS